MSKREIIWVKNGRKFVELNYEEICRCIKYFNHEWDDGKVHRNPWNELEHRNYVLCYLVTHTLNYVPSKDGRCITYPYKCDDDESKRGITHWYPSRYLFNNIKFITWKYVSECVYEKTHDRSDNIKGLIPKEYYDTRIRSMEVEHFPHAWVDRLKKHLQCFSDKSWVKIAIKFIDMTIEGYNKAEVAEVCGVKSAYMTQIMKRIQTAFPSFEKLSLAEGVKN